MFKKVFFILLIFSLVVLRFVFLGQDLPSMRVVNLCEFDQFYYTQGALSFFHNGTFVLPLQPYAGFGRSLFDFFENLWTAPFLSLFGNNFYGFKLPTVLLSLMSIFFLVRMMILFEINLIIIKISTVFLLIEFMFFESSRVQGPTIYSFFGCSLLLFLFAEYENSMSISKKNMYLFLIGFCGIFLVFFIYIYNLFLFGAIFVSAGLFFFFIKKEIKPVLYIFLGSIAGFAIYNLTTYLVYEQTAYDLFLGLKHFGGGADFAPIKTPTLSILSKIIGTVAAFFTINFFRFNLFLFVLIVPSFFLFLRNFIKSKDRKFFHVFLFTALFFAVCQTWIEPGYSAKKLSVLFPVFLFIIVYSINEYLKGNKGFVILNKLGAFLLLLLGFFSALYCYRITTADWYESYRPGANTYFYLNSINLICCFLVFISLCIYQFPLFPKKIGKIVLVTCMLLPSSFFIFQYVLLNNTSDFKSSLIRISKFSDNKNMAGVYLEQLSLYNNFNPVLPYFAVGDTALFRKAYTEALEKDSIQILSVAYETTPSNLDSYNEKVVVKKLGDTLVSGNKFFVLVDEIVKTKQGVDIYVGQRKNRVVNY